MPPVIFPLRTPPNRPGGRHYDFTDAFVTTYNSTATDYLFSTYLGGDMLRLTAAAIAVFTAGGGHCYVHVTGETRSFNFPTRNPVQPSLSSVQHDAFVARIDVTTGALLFSTYLGGTGLDSW